MTTALPPSSPLAPAGAPLGIARRAFRRSTFQPRRRERVLLVASTTACGLTSALLIAGVALVR